MCIQQKSDSLKKKYDILIILVDFYASLSGFFLLPRSGFTFPEVDPDQVQPNEVDPAPKR